jgi:hypothetical protein
VWISVVSVWEVVLALVCGRDRLAEVGALLPRTTHLGVMFDGTPNRPSSAK